MYKRSKPLRANEQLSVKFSHTIYALLRGERLIAIHKLFNAFTDSDIMPILKITIPVYRFIHDDVEF